MAFIQSLKSYGVGGLERALKHTSTGLPSLITFGQVIPGLSRLNPYERHRERDHLFSFLGIIFIYPAATDISSAVCTYTANKVFIYIHMTSEAGFNVKWKKC